MNCYCGQMADASLDGRVSGEWTHSQVGCSLQPNVSRLLADVCEQAEKIRKLDARVALLLADEAADDRTIEQLRVRLLEVESVSACNRCRKEWQKQSQMQKDRIAALEIEATELRAKLVDEVQRSSKLLAQLAQSPPPIDSDAVVSFQNLVKAVFAVRQGCRDVEKVYQSARVHDLAKGPWVAP